MYATKELSFIYLICIVFHHIADEPASQAVEYGLHGRIDVDIERIHVCLVEL